MKTLFATILCTACLATIGGCPLNNADKYQSTAVAKISIASTTGEAPFHAIVSGAASTTQRGQIVSYKWHFADEATSESVAAEHTFTLPGRYPITLTVVDSNGEQASTLVYVRVKGGDVTAVIKASRLSGMAPMGVQFDGTESTAVDDTILDYYWDFGDMETSRQSTPYHTFEYSGTYTVTLKAVSAGGVEGYAEATVTAEAGAGGSSLRFDGVQYCNLPVTTDAALGEFTFEAWCLPDAAGGTVVNFGSPNVSIEVTPGVGVVVRSGDDATSVSGGIVAEQWCHVAVSYADGAGARVFLNGVHIGDADVSGEFDVSLLSLGAGFYGNLARVRFWSDARTDSEIASGVSGSTTGYEENLLGYWPLDDDSGQTVSNEAENGSDGTLGAGESEEYADPTWADEGP